MPSAFLRAGWGPERAGCAQAGSSGRAGLGLGACGAQCPGPFLLPDGLCQHQCFLRRIPCCCRLGAGSLVRPTNPEPCRKGCVPDWGVQLGLKADLGRKPHSPRCPLSSDCWLATKRTLSQLGGSDRVRVCRGGGRVLLPQPELPTPPGGGGPHQSHPDPWAGLTSCFSAGPWP